MPDWKPIVGLSFNAADFDEYCKSRSWTNWRPAFIVLHNTGVPSLAQRPNGLTAQHIQSLVGFYRDTQHWRAGPHLFVDDHQIWVFTPLTTQGTHSPSWNSISLGIEMLGDYGAESFSTGRGLLVRRNAVSAMASLSRVLGLDPKGMKLHKEDPKTTHDCPGKNVKKADMIAEVQAAMAQLHGADHNPAVGHPDV